MPPVVRESETGGEWEKMDGVLGRRNSISSYWQNGERFLPPTPTECFSVLNSIGMQNIQIKVIFIRNLVCLNSTLHTIFCIHITLYYPHKFLRRKFNIASLKGF